MDSSETQLKKNTCGQSTGNLIADRSSKKIGGGYRSRLIDFVRGVAIILVVLGHNIQFSSGTEFLSSGAYFDNWLFKFIYSFHMPLFAVISGYLFYWSMKYDAVALVRRRFSSLVVPSITWAVLFTILRGAYWIVVGKFAIFPLVKAFAGEALHGLWFLWAMFWSSFFVILIEKVFKGRVVIYFLLLVSMIFEVKHSTYTFMYLYFVAGFLFNKYGKNLQKRVIEHWKLYTFISVATFAVMFSFYGYNSYIYTTGTSPLGRNGMIQLLIDIYRWGIGLVGSVAVILLARVICENWSDAWLIKVVARFGQLSIGVYILNKYANMVLPKLLADVSPSIGLWLLETIIALPLYLLAIYIIKKLPYGNKLLLGGR